MDDLMVPLMKGVLTARRNSLKDKEKGFTLIELLVVIVIIGILAAIAIPVYLGVQNNAKDSVAKTDLASAKTAVVAYLTDKNVLPTAITSTILTTYGYSVNPSDVAWGATAPTTTAFCLVATSATAKLFYATDSSGVTNVNPGGC